MAEGSQSSGRLGEQLFNDSEVTIFSTEHHPNPQGCESQAEIL